MPALAPEQIGDLVLSVLEQPVVGRWVDVSLSNQHYIFAERFGNSTLEDGGTTLTWRLQVTNNNTTRYSGMYDTDNVSAKNLIKQAQVQWSKNTSSFVYDIDEPEFTKTPRQVLDHIEVRKHSMYNDKFQFQETALWTLPSATAENRELYGIPYWIVKDGTGSGPKAFGFNGGDPSGFSLGAADILTADVDQWKNGTFRYATLSEDDGYDKWSEACDKCYFRAPNPHPSLGEDRPRYGFYTTYSVLQATRRDARASNDNVGTDLGAYRGETYFKSVPIIWVPVLSNDGEDAEDTSNPIYGIDWNNLEYVNLSGVSERFTGPTQRNNAHTTMEVHRDEWGQLRCFNRRSAFVGHVG